MISGISGSGSYIFMYRYTFSGGSSSARMAHAAGSMGTSAAGQTASVSQISTRTEGSLNGRVNPVSGVKGVVPGYREDTVPDLFIRRGVDPAEYAVRMRIQYAEPSAAGLPGQEEAVPGIGKASEAADDGKCRTCEQRKYQDGSNDMGVSFKTPTRIAPEAAGAMVRHKTKIPAPICCIHLYGYILVLCNLTDIPHAFQIPADSFFADTILGCELSQSLFAFYIVTDNLGFISPDTTIKTTATVLTFITLGAPSQTVPDHIFRSAEKAFF